MEHLTLLTRRIERLERTNRRLKLGLLVVLVILVSTVLMAQVTMQTMPIKMHAQTYEVQDENGLARGVFGVEPDGSASLKLYDATGEVVWSTP